MKNFIVVLRNVGAVSCIGVAVIFCVMNIRAFFLATHISSVAAYAEAKEALGENFLLIPIIILANVFLKTEERKCLSFLWYCCVCGVLSAVMWGFLVLISGFRAGHLLMPLLLFWVALNSCMVIFFASVYFANRNRFIKDDISTCYGIDL